VARPRDVLNRILWLMRTDVPWKDLPDRSPLCQTCNRRFQLSARLAARSIESIAPNRRNRHHNQRDGRPVRRYRRGWKVERLFAWLQGFRRLVTRHERRAKNLFGFVQLACVVILPRHL